MSDVIQLSNFIAGNWQPSLCEHWIENFSPATGEHIANIPCSSSEDIDLAVEAALDAAEQLSQFSINERADWLEKIADELEQRTDESPNWKASTQANRLPLHAMSMRLVLWPIFVSLQSKVESLNPKFLR